MPDSWKYFNTENNIEIKQDMFQSSREARCLADQVELYYNNPSPQQGVASPQGSYFTQEQQQQQLYQQQLQQQLQQEQERQRQEQERQRQQEQQRQEAGDSGRSRRDRA